MVSGNRWEILFIPLNPLFSCVLLQWDSGVGSTHNQLKRLYTIPLSPPDSVICLGPIFTAMKNDEKSILSHCCNAFPHRSAQTEKEKKKHLAGKEEEHSREERERVIERWGATRAPFSGSSINDG